MKYLMQMGGEGIGEIGLGHRVQNKTKDLLDIIWNVELSLGRNPTRPIASAEIGDILANMLVLWT